MKQLQAVLSAKRALRDAGMSFHCLMSFYNWRLISCITNLELQDESVKQTAKLMYQTALMESGFMLNDPKEFASSIYDSVKRSLNVNPEATVEEDDVEEETETDVKEETPKTDGDDNEPEGLRDEL